MNHISFEVGDRVRHKLTQIQGEIVQLEQSLAMPHAWVIEPSVCDVNPPTLYRLTDLEKLEDSVEGAQTTNQAQGVNPNISLSDRKPEVNSLTSNDFLGELVLIVEKETTTVSTELGSPVLTVEQELLTLCSESVSGEQIASKPLPISVKSSSPPMGNTSTSNELPREPVLTVETSSTLRASDETTQGSNKRRKGEGTGRIQLRTITKKNGKLLSAILVRLASTYKGKNNLQKCLHSEKIT